MSKKTICIVQMTRTGDILQACKALSFFTSRRDEYNLVLISRTQFTGGVKFIVDKIFDRNITFDLKEFVNDPKTANLKDTQANIMSFINSIGEIDVLINFSYSRSSNYLTSLIPAKYKLGAFYNNQNELYVGDKWSQYVQSTVLTSSLNPFNLVDLLKAAIGIKKVDSEKLIFKNEKRKNEIVIHPFGSKDKKLWSLEKWVEVVYKVLSTHPNHSVSIVGSKDDMESSNKIISSPILTKFQTRIKSHAGSFSIEDTYNLLTTSSLFVGHDSMVGHLASLANTPAVTLFLGSTRPHDTTPYLQGNLSVVPKSDCYPCFTNDKCDFFKCHLDVPVAAFSEIISFKLQSEVTDLNAYLSSNISPILLSSFAVYSADFFQKNTDFMVLDNITDDILSLSDLLKTVYRISWLYFNDEVEETVNFPKLNRNVHKELLHYLKGLELYYELAGFGQKYSKFILVELNKESPSIEEIQGFSKNIDEIDRLQYNLKDHYSGLTPLVDFFSLQKFTLGGSSVVKLSEQSYYSYTQAMNFTSLMSELIEGMIQEYKINETKPLATR